MTTAAPPQSKGLRELQAQLDEIDRDGGVERLERELERLERRKRELERARAGKRLSHIVQAPPTFKAARLLPGRAREMWFQVHRETRAVFAAAGLSPAAAAGRAGFPVEVVQKFTGTRMMIESFALGRLLRACGAQEATIGRLVETMAIVEDTDTLGLPLWRPDELEVSDLELRVTTCVELANVLLHLVNLSGIPKLRLAEQAGISRSQLYNLINAERNSLPRNRDQLYALLRTCTVSERQTDLVLRQWVLLDRVREATTRHDALPELPLTPAFHDDLKDQRPAPADPEPADGLKDQQLAPAESRPAVEPDVRGRRRVGTRQGVQVALVAGLAAVLGTASIVATTVGSNLLAMFGLSAPGAVVAVVLMLLLAVGIVAKVGLFARAWVRGKGQGSSTRGGRLLAEVKE